MQQGDYWEFFCLVLTGDQKTALWPAECQKPPLRSGPPRGSVSLERVPGQENVLGLRTVSPSELPARLKAQSLRGGDPDPRLCPQSCLGTRLSVHLDAGLPFSSGALARGTRSTQRREAWASTVRLPLLSKGPRAPAETIWLLSEAEDRTVRSRSAPPMQSWEPVQAVEKRPPQPRAGRQEGLRLLRLCSAYPSPLTARPSFVPWLGRGSGATLASPRAWIPLRESGCSLARACVAGCLLPEVHRRKNPDQRPPSPSPGAQGHTA